MQRKEKLIVSSLVLVVVGVSAFLGCRFALYEKSGTSIDSNVINSKSDKSIYEDKALDEVVKNKEEKVVDKPSEKVDVKEDKKEVVKSTEKKEEVKQEVPKETEKIEVSVDNEVSATDNTLYTNQDQEAIQAFSLMEDNVDKLLKTSNKTDSKNKVKGVFVSIVDFIFYGADINGVTFDSLTQAGKEKILSIASSIDGKIESKLPGYKETISDKASKALNKASEIIKKGATNIDSFAREKLGEEYYQNMIDAKDELVFYTNKAMSFVGNIGSNLFSKGKDFLNNWYQNFKK